MQEIQEDNGGFDDFSFVCLNPDGSPISAEDAFVNGQIRPVFPIFDQTPSLRPQLNNLFTEDRTRVSPEFYCEWSPSQNTPAPASAPALGKKSYSTGFSKLWRFGEKIRRSSSEGKDAFVFLRSASSGSGKGGEKAEKNRKDAKVKAAKGKTAAYHHERLYARNRAENEMNKRKSYLPYRSNLVGFFTSPNSLNRNF